MSVCIFHASLCFNNLNICVKVGHFTTKPDQTFNGICACHFYAGHAALSMLAKYFHPSIERAVNVIWTKFEQSF